mmetsp:Transcript_42705/g.107799  ORF Transcript_42705/g.107799 Transcript_42705/m.107799 type:complete len:286 (+) Transcript_42705:1518-2375(+)
MELLAVGHLHAQVEVAVGHRGLDLLEREARIGLRERAVQTARARHTHLHLHLEPVLHEGVDALQQRQQMLAGVGTAHKQHQLVRVRIQRDAQPVLGLHQDDAVLPVVAGRPVEGVQEAHDQPAHEAERHELELVAAGKAQLLVGGHAERLGPLGVQHLLLGRVVEQTRDEEVLFVQLEHHLELLQQLEHVGVQLGRMTRRTPHLRQRRLLEQTTLGKVRLHGHDRGKHLRDPLRIDHHHVAVHVAEVHQHAQVVQVGGQRGQRLALHVAALAHLRERLPAQRRHR